MTIEIESSQEMHNLQNIKGLQRAAQLHNDYVWREREKDDYVVFSSCRPSQAKQFTMFFHRIEYSSLRCVNVFVSKKYIFSSLVIVSMYWRDFKSCCVFPLLQLFSDCSWDRQWFFWIKYFYKTQKNFTRLCTK